MCNSILGLELIKRGNVGGTVISDKFGNSSVATKNILENEIHKGDSSFALKHACFREQTERAACMYHVPEASCPWHIKGINVHFAKERARHCDDGWNINVMEMSGLTDIARVCKPLDIHTHVRPPKAFYKMRVGGVHTTVTYLVMRLSEKLQTTTWGNDNLVFSVGVLVPKIFGRYEEA